MEAGVEPLCPSTADELRWYSDSVAGVAVPRTTITNAISSGTRRPDVPSAHLDIVSSIAPGCAKEPGNHATSSPALADAITRGAGRFEAHVLARPYLHLSSLVGRHEPSSWGDTPKRPSGATARDRAEPDPSRWRWWARSRSRQGASLTLGPRRSRGFGLDGSLDQAEDRQLLDGPGRSGPRADICRIARTI